MSDRLNKLERSYTPGKPTYITLDGDRMTLNEWAEELDIKYATISARILRGETDVHKLLQRERLPVGWKKGRKRKDEHQSRERRPRDANASQQR